MPRRMTLREKFDIFMGTVSVLTLVAIVILIATLVNALGE